MIENVDFFVLEDPEAYQHHLDRTGLSIQLASYEPDQTVFLAAHGLEDSILLGRVMGELTVWHIVNFSKEDRQELAAQIRASMVKMYNGIIE
jgi:uncharacterized protein YbgA (DUF1722 family)